MLEITAQLERIVAAEKLSVDKEVIYAIAKASDGSLRDAESVLDQLVSFSKEKISLKDIISVLGLVEQDALFAITEKISQKDSVGALELFNKLIDDGKDMTVFLNNLIEHFRNLMIAKVTKGDIKLIDLPQEICEKLLKQSQIFSLEEIFGIFNILVNTQEMSKRLDSLRIPLEISLVKLTHDKKSAVPAVPVQRPKEKIDSPKVDLPVKEDIRPEPPKKKEDEIQASKEISPVSLENVKESWSSLISNLEKVKMSVATYLTEAVPLKLHGTTLTLGFPKNYSLHKESLEAKDNKALIEKGIAELLHANLRVHFIISEEVRKREDTTSSSPFVKSAMDMFHGRVVREE